MGVWSGDVGQTQLCPLETPPCNLISLSVKSKQDQLSKVRMEIQKSSLKTWYCTVRWSYPHRPSCLLATAGGTVLLTQIFLCTNGIFPLPLFSWLKKLFWFEIGFHYIAQVGSELLTVPCLDLQCWDYRCTHHTQLTCILRSTLPLLDGWAGWTGLG